MTGGFKYNSIRLNHSLAKLEHWNKKQIHQRAVDLADMAVEIWKAPALSLEVLNTYKPQTNNEAKRALAPTPQEICTRADKEGIGEEFRKILYVALRHGLYARPNVRSVMYTPDSNRNRMLFTVWLRSQRPKQGSMVICPETFVEFYPVDQQTAA